MSWKTVLGKGLLVVVIIVATMSFGNNLACADEAEAEYHFYKSRVAFSGGAAFLLESKPAGYVGLDYEFRFHKRFGVGLFGNWSFGGFDVGAYGIPFYVHALQGTKFFIAPGMETKLNEDKSKMMVRVGLTYEYPLDKYTIGPTFAVDFIDSGEEGRTTKEVFYAGIVVGIGF